MANTGWKGGSIHPIEVAKEEKVLWDIYLLHMNELHLRHLLNSLGLEITDPNKFKGDIGQIISDELHLYEVNQKFEVLGDGESLRDLSEDVVIDLSTDQKYLYKIVSMIKTGTIVMAVLKEIIGPMCHSHWLNTASRICRLWVSQHGFRRNSLAYKDLKTMVKFIINNYAVLWFDIKCNPHILNGPRHTLKSMKLAKKYCSEDVMTVIKPVMENGACSLVTSGIPRGD